MHNRREGVLKKVAREIGEEAARQVRGWPHEARRQVLGGWGSELAHQIFGTPRRNRRRSR